MSNKPVMALSATQIPAAAYRTMLEAVALRSELGAVQQRLAATKTIPSAPIE
jgi:hypothetical protein